MVKEHVVEVVIVNSTQSTLKFVHDWFDSGRVADDNSWPATIEPHANFRVKCYERDWSGAGCSGWVCYALNGNNLYFAFSNPSFGTNKIGLGNSDSVWDNMDAHYGPFYGPFDIKFTDSTWVTAQIRSTGGATNTATWLLAGHNV